LRSDLTGAQDAYNAAARLNAWSILYAAIIPIWWPAALIAAATMTTAVLRARSSAGALADLAETAIDLHTPELAEKLGLPCNPGLPLETGQAITRRLGLVLPVSSANGPLPRTDGGPSIEPIETASHMNIEK